MNPLAAACRGIGYGALSMVALGLQFEMPMPQTSQEFGGGSGFRVRQEIRRPKEVQRRDDELLLMVLL